MIAAAHVQAEWPQATGPARAARWPSDRVEDSRLAVRALAVPDAPAMRVKRQGRWIEWSWRDAADEVTRLAAGLAAAGLRSGDRLWVCGPFEPSLLCVALAARRAGGVVEAVGGRHPKAALTRACIVPPAIVYVRDRDAAAGWLAAADAADVAATIVFDGLDLLEHIPLGSKRSEQQGYAQVIESGAISCRPDDSIWSESALDGDAGGARSLPLARLRRLGDAPVPPHRRGRARRAAPLVWVEEGSGWRGGLELILETWLAEGCTLAFPEERRSADRDRREARPDAVLVSPTRLNAIAAGLGERLYRQPAPVRRLAGWALADDRRWWTPGPRALARTAIRRSLGFGRLGVVRVGPDRGAEPVFAATATLFKRLGAAVEAVRPAPPPVSAPRWAPPPDDELGDAYRDPAWSSFAGGWT